MDKAVVVAYSKLKKSYPELPELSELRKMLPVLKEEDVKSLEALISAMFKQLRDLATQLEVFLTPPNFSAMQDKEFLKPRRAEITQLFVRTHYLLRFYSLEFNKALDTAEPEKILSELAGKIVGDYLCEIRPKYFGFVEVLVEKWRDAEISGSSEVYHG